MKKLVSIILSVVLIFSICVIAACAPSDKEEPEETLQITQCFKDLVMFQRFKSGAWGSEDTEEVAVRGENLSFSQFVNDQIEMDRYSFFMIFTTEKAAKIRITQIKFDVVVETDCNVMFSLTLGENDIHYSTTVTTNNLSATVVFEGLNKGWSVEDAGNSELHHLDETTYPIESPAWDYLVGDVNTYMKLALVNKSELVDNNYAIKNLEIEFDVI